MHRVEAYRRPNGEVPFEGFVKAMLASGNPAIVAGMHARVEKLREHGLYGLMQTQMARKIEDDLYELRTKQLRVFFFWDARDQTYKLLNGFRKTTPKTPNNEIQRAINLRAECLRLA